MIDFVVALSGALLLAFAFTLHLLLFSNKSSDSIYFSRRKKYLGTRLACALPRAAPQQLLAHPRPRKGRRRKRSKVTSDTEPVIFQPVQLKLDLPCLRYSKCLGSKFKHYGAIYGATATNLLNYHDFVGVEKLMQKKSAGQYTAPCNTSICFCIVTNVAELVVNQTRTFVLDMAQILWSLL